MYNLILSLDRGGGYGPVKGRMVFTYASNQEQNFVDFIQCVLKTSIIPLKKLQYFTRMAHKKYGRMKYYGER